MRQAGRILGGGLGANDPGVQGLACEGKKKNLLELPCQSVGKTTPKAHHGGCATCKANPSIPLLAAYRDSRWRLLTDPASNAQQPVATSQTCKSGTEKKKTIEEYNRTEAYEILPGTEDLEVT